MTIDEAITEVQQQKLDYQEFWEEYKNEHIEALDIAIATMRKYQKLQADYEARLKADMVAMLTELQLEIEEIEIDVPFGFEPVSKTSAFYEGVSASSKVIQQKIDKLKETD